VTASAAKHVDYYLSPSSPWTYLGHSRFVALAAAAGVTVNAKPVDFGVIFPQSGGLPLPKRAPQRQAYRLAELARWKAFLGIPLVIQPKNFPVDATQAALLICGAPAQTRLALAGDLLSALWAEDRNLADLAVLSAVATRHGVADAAAAIAAGKSAYEANTAEAMTQGVFGAPSYVYRGEIFWGQDRLDFLQRTLSAG
jgi:carboxymethylenebutenolidase